MYDDKILGVVIPYLGKIKEIHMYFEHPIDELDLSYDFSSLPSIFRNLDIGSTIEKVHQKEGGSFRKDQSGVGTENSSEFDYFCGTQGSE